MAKIFEFSRPEQKKEKSCSWCKNRETHPLDPAVCEMQVVRS